MFYSVDNMRYQFWGVSRSKAGTDTRLNAI
ncbi:hypothetical protein GECvBMG_gp204 [Salmonella phage GEC_vB_MG]|nr:hypothetical protein GECvBMG_gp204 [Salmonella phage GEC_vB_MG]